MLLRENDNHMNMSNQQIQELKEDLQKCQMANSQLQNEEKELQVRLSTCNEECERNQQEHLQLKKQVTTNSNVYYWL